MLQPMSLAVGLNVDELTGLKTGGGSGHVLFLTYR